MFRTLPRLPKGTKNHHCTTRVMVEASSHVPLYSLVESTQRVYGLRLFFYTCVLCAAGKYSTPTTTGASVCVDCPAAKYSIGTGAQTDILCIDCVTGNFSTPGASACKLCVVGKYIITATSSCLDCVAGKFNNAEGMMMLFIGT